MEQLIKICTINGGTAFNIIPEFVEMTGTIRTLKPAVRAYVFKRVEEITNQPPIEVFEEALNNIMPTFEVKSRRIGGQNYQVPVEVRDERKYTLGLRWLTLYARLRNEKTMEDRLAKEIVDAAAGNGASVKKKDDTHRMAEANKAFAHYRW